MDRCLQIALASEHRSAGKSLADCLADLGHAVTRTGIGESLLELCWSICPHLAIGDLRSSGSGLEVAGLVRREFAVPVILIAKHWDPAEVEYAEALGITRLVEPFRPLTLITAIDRALRESEYGGLRPLLCRRRETGAYSALHL